METDEVEISFDGVKEEIQKILAGKSELENYFKNLNDKLYSALSECDAKEDLLRKTEVMAHEALAGWENAEREAEFLKKKLDEVLGQRVASEERSSDLDGALKGCMQQLRFVREEQEQRIHHAVIKTSEGYEKAQANLEKKLEKVVTENFHLNKSLLVKEKLVEESNRRKNQVDVNFNALKNRSETIEKDNASMQYKIRVLEKEIEILNEEREFNRRTAEESHRQHLHNVKKIAKLESEIQRLHSLVRKCSPDDAALPKIKNVEILGWDCTETGSINSSACSTAISAVHNYPDSRMKKIDILTNLLCATEEENKSLKIAVNKIMNELQFSRSMYGRAAFKLTEAESQIELSSKSRITTHPSRSSVMSTHELSVASMSDFGSDDKVSCAESLLSELENCRVKKQESSMSSNMAGASEMNLMDDFAEMEKLVEVSTENPFGNSIVSVDNDIAAVDCSKTESKVYLVEEANTDFQSNLSLPGQETKSKMYGTPHGWLHDIMKLILEQQHVSERNFEEVAEEVKVALLSVNHVVGYNSLKPFERTLVSDSPRVADEDISSDEKDNQNLGLDISESICKVIEIVEGIRLPLLDNGVISDNNCLSSKNSETPSGYTIRVFQWKSSELIDIVQQFLDTSYDLLNGKADIKKFAKELSSSLDWTMNHCFTLHDVSTMRDAVKKQFDWDGLESKSEAEVRGIDQLSEADVVYNKQNILPETDDYQFYWREEKRKLRDELKDKETENKELEGRLQESDKILKKLEMELETSRNCKGVIANQSANKYIMADFDKQIMVAKAELRAAPRNSHYAEGVESTDLEQQCQLESVRKNELSSCELKQEEKEHRTELEITAASEKLAECQETILHLGKQLKELANPKEAALFDKLLAANHTINVTTSKTNTTNHNHKKKVSRQRSSLLEQMMAEDNNKSKDPNSYITRRSEGNLDFFSKGTIEAFKKIILSSGSKHSVDDNASVDSLAIFPIIKHRRKSFWRRLIWRKKKGNFKKLTFPFAT